MTLATRCGRTHLVLGLAIFAVGLRVPEGDRAVPTVGMVESSKSRGAYVAPNAGRLLFGEHARRWMETWNTERTTAAKDRSIMETHVLPRWGDMPLGKVDQIGL